MNFLHKRALAFEYNVETHMVDEHGLLLSALNINNMRPFEPVFFTGKSILNYPGHSWSDFSEFIAYENVGMCTGAYLAAMIWKYRATKDLRALDKAHRCFKAIEWLYKLSSQQETGFFCKCYGGKFSEQTSSDQYLYVFAGLNEYMHFAPHDVRNRCIEMIANMVSFWMNRNYKYQYFGHPLDWPLERFPAFPWLAFHYTGEEVFLEEFKRLCVIPEVRNKIPFGQLSYQEILNHARNREVFFDFEKESSTRVIIVSSEHTQSGFLSLSPMLEYNAPNRDLWMDKAGKMFDCGKRWIAADGYSKRVMIYNLETGELSEVKERLYVPDDNEKWKFIDLVAWIRSGMHSAMFARAAVALSRYFPNSEALGLAAFILKKLDHNKLRWFVDMDGRQMPKDLQWINNTYSGDAVTNWLWAYWEACANYGFDWLENVEQGGPHED